MEGLEDSANRAPLLSAISRDFMPGCLGGEETPRLGDDLAIRADGGRCAPKPWKPWEPWKGRGRQAGLVGFESRNLRPRPWRIDSM